MFKPFNIEDLPVKKCGKYGESYLVKDIMGFVESGLSCAEVILDEQKKLKNPSANYAIVAKRIGAPIKAIQRSGRVFLIREENNA